MPNPRGRPSLIVVLKVFVSTVLLAATAGWLWHAHGEPELWAHSRPDWWRVLAHGWYPEAARYVGSLWRAGPFQSAVYAAVSIFCVLTIFALPFVCSSLVRVALSTIVVPGIGYDITMFDIGGDLPSFGATDTVLSNVRFGLEGTAQQYLPQISRNLALVAVALPIFWWPPPILSRRAAWIPVAIVLAATAGVLGIFWRTAGSTAFFPSPFTSYLNAYVAVTSADRPIAALDYSGSPISRFRYIVFIVDESVRGDYLSINNPAIRTTPFLLSREGDIANFGEAVSAANCSIDSRRALRFGYQEGDMPSAHAHQRLPPFWLHAKRAGLQTVYIDTYGSVTLLVNDMKHSEAALIDKRIIVQDKPQYLRDEVAARDLRELLRDPSPKFIFVEKFGVHIPYDKMYPPTQNFFDADMGRFGFEDRANMLKHYENSIRWNVDHFFEDVLRAPLPHDTLILYTSDHGQSLSERGRTTSHCNQGPNAVQGEANVPLFAITGNPDWDEKFKSAARRNFGRASHLEIFSTLLVTMGYDPQWVHAHHGPSLLDDLPAQPRRFWATGAFQHYDPTR